MYHTTDASDKKLFCVSPFFGVILNRIRGPVGKGIKKKAFPIQSRLLIKVQIKIKAKSNGDVASLPDWIPK